MNSLSFLATTRLPCRRVSTRVVNEIASHSPAGHVKLMKARRVRAFHGSFEFWRALAGSVRWTHLFGRSITRPVMLAVLLMRGHSRRAPGIFLHRQNPPNERRKREESTASCRPDEKQMLTPSLGNLAFSPQPFDRRTASRKCHWALGRRSFRSDFVREIGATTITLVFVTCERRTARYSGGKLFVVVEGNFE